MPDCSIESPDIALPKDLWRVLWIAYAKSTKQPKIMLPKDSGYHVPVEVGVIPGKGRGVYTTSLIRKGALVSSDSKDIVFHSAEQFKRFLRLGKLYALTLSLTLTLESSLTVV